MKLILDNMGFVSDDYYNLNYNKFIKDNKDSIYNDKDISDEFIYVKTYDFNMFTCFRYKNTNSDIETLFYFHFDNENGDEKLIFIKEISTNDNIKHFRTNTYFRNLMWYIVKYSENFNDWEYLDSCNNSIIYSKHSDDIDGSSSYLIFYLGTWCYTIESFVYVDETTTITSKDIDKLVEYIG